ncbi:hypothetical protein V753_17405 [Bacillus velezensis]|nr:hypothetical protein MY7_3454 [Bacillus sp. 5B6]UHY16947.1 hypothetical protein V753_17405 [Bacillus velezensis]
MRRKRENNTKTHGLILAIAGTAGTDHGKENGLHHYAGSYPIVGRLRKGWPKFHIERAGDIRFSFSLPSTTFFIPKGFPDPIIHLDFSLLLPWVLEEDAD